MSTQNPPKKDPLSSLFVQPPPPSEDGAPSDTPEPGHIRATKPVSRPMPPPVLPPSPSAGPDPRQLAKALAKAAVAKAGAAAPRAPAAPAADQRKVAPAESKPAVRGVAAAPPPTRKLSALEAMELARKQEAEREAVVPPPPVFSAPAKAAPTKPAPAAPVIAAAPAPAAPAQTVTDDQLGDVVQTVLGANLPGAQVYVANAMFAEDRKALTALWRSHRARFLATHQVEYAVGASLVLHHLGHAAAGQLAVAHGVTDKGEFLLWVDLDARVLITAFANPRQLVAGW